jgi:hypothetical protein
MKKLLFTVTMSIVSTMVMAFTVIGRIKPQPFVMDEGISPQLILSAPIIVAPKLDLKVKNHDKFLDDMGFRESSNNYRAVNQFGYLGKYQFGRKTLNGLGYSNISNRQFLSNPSIQEQAMLDLLAHNKKILKKYIEKYDGKVVHGILVTESGILAAAHLAGPTNVKKFFRKGQEFKDGNGTKLTSYLKKFSNYTLDL